MMKLIKGALFVLSVTVFVLKTWAGYTDDCLTFSSSTTFALKTFDLSEHWTGTLWTSTDKTNWTEWDGSSVAAAEVGSSFVLHVRGDAKNKVITGSDSGGRWEITGTAGVYCSGNVETLRGAVGDEPSPTPMGFFCYNEMFSDCLLLKSAPTLPATTLATGCYQRMFFCSGLENAPVLPATILAPYCYTEMFSGCWRITHVPVLPATTLAQSCYERMFGDCSSLADVPMLPATTLASCCYREMFSGCASLTDVPSLPATALTNGCYGRMFYGCSSLAVNTTAPGKEWKLPVESATASYWGTDMFSHTSGTLKGEPELGTTYYVKSGRTVYTDDCITFSSSASFVLCAPQNWYGTLWTSTDKTNWSEWHGSAVCAAQANGTGPYRLHVRGNDLNENISGRHVVKSWNLVGDAGIACSGNIETLRGATGDAPSPTPMEDRCYDGMFQNCALLTSAPILSATVLTDSCYYKMFSGCTSLTNAPVLPATTLASHCYYGMFSDCTSLRTVPPLSATMLASSCCASMFSGCTSLTNAPFLPATALANSCYYSMFSGCASLTDAPELPATKMESTCYHDMFSGCTSLTNAPTLPAMELENSCYSRMFSNCTSLPSAPVLPATTLKNYCYESMFSGCTLIKTAPALPATSLAIYCYNRMFAGCTSLKGVPELPATALTNSCYNSMFCGCTSLEVNVAEPGMEWKIPVECAVTSNWGTDMFSGTSGTLQGEPVLCTTCYVKSALLPGSKGEPWQIGAEEGDVISAWTNGTVLVIEGSGRIRDFAADGSDVPWSAAEIAAVEVSGEVTAIGQNSWCGLGDSVTYNGFSSMAAKTMSCGFGVSCGYARTSFKDMQFTDGAIHFAVALEKAPSLTNEWVEVKLEAKDVTVDADGRIVITHEDVNDGVQCFYIMR